MENARKTKVVLEPMENIRELRLDVGNYGKHKENLGFAWKQIENA